MKISHKMRFWFKISICQNVMLHKGRWVNFLTMVGKHQSAREILHETAILWSSVHIIIHRDLQLKCFKGRRAQVLSEASHISHLTHW